MTSLIEARIPNNPPNNRYCGHESIPKETSEPAQQCENAKQQIAKKDAPTVNLHSKSENKSATKKQNNPLMIPHCFWVRTDKPQKGLAPSPFRLPCRLTSSKKTRLLQKWSVVTEASQSLLEQRLTLLKLTDAPF